MDKAKLEEYINLCAPSFLIKMKKTKNDEPFFFKANKIFKELFVLSNNM